MWIMIIAFTHNREHFRTPKYAQRFCSAMLQSPTGTVTFLFTDIEGSTKIWESSPVAMRSALACHDKIARDAIEANGGYVFKTIGDAFCAAFSTAAEAVQAAADTQLVLFFEPWEVDPPVRVRMAVHTGVAEARDSDYYGQPVNRVARLLSAGHGGQILVSAATQELIRDALPADCTLHDLGEASLKDLSRPERVYQLQVSELPSEFPPLRTLNSPELPNNLPLQATSFIGREREMGEVKALLASARLVTLTGTGGTGKTRLALQAAADLLEGDGEGVWLVELASVTDAALVPQVIAQALGIREESGTPIARSLTQWLKPKRLLLVLDNCEHLVEEIAALVADLLRSSPGLHVLATSRERLNLAGERVYRVPTMGVPRRSGRSGQIGAFKPTAEMLWQYESVRLFVERVQAVQPTFSLRDGDAPALASICEKLDGIPLALELAAARVRSMSVTESNARLDNCFRLLKGGSRSSLPRQQTLQALVDWSYELLTPKEQAMMQRCSIFAGGWTLAEAEQVCCDGTIIEVWEALDLLSSLVDKSLVNTDEAQETSTTRYRLLETLRQYSTERRAESTASGDEITWRHLRYFTGLAEQANKGLDGSESVRWIKQLSADLDNIRAAMSFALEQPNAEPALRLAAEMYDFAIQRGFQSECRHWIDTALPNASDEGETGYTKCRALIAAGNIAVSLCDWHQAAGYYQKALGIAQAQNITRLIAACLGNIATTEIEQGAFQAAELRLQECLAIYTSAGEMLNASAVYSALGSLCAATGQLDRAIAHYENGLEIFREAGASSRVAFMLENIGGVHLQRREYELANRNFMESLQIRCAVNNRHGFHSVLPDIALLASETGRHEIALQCAEHVKKLQAEMQINDSEHLRKVAQAVDLATSVLGSRASQEITQQAFREDTFNFCSRLIETGCS